MRKGKSFYCQPKSKNFIIVLQTFEFGIIELQVGSGGGWSDGPSNFIVSQSPNLLHTFEFSSISKLISILDFRPLDLDFWAWQKVLKLNMRHYHVFGSLKTFDEIMKKNQLEIENTKNLDIFNEYFWKVVNRYFEMSSIRHFQLIY